MSDDDAKPGELDLKGKSTIEILAQIDMFSGLPATHLRRVVDIGLEEQYRSSATIFAEGSPGDKFYLIVDGAVRISRIVPGMGEEALAVLRPGAYFGEMSLLSGEPTTATVAAVGSVELALLQPRDFYEIASEHPELWSAIRREARNRALENARLVAGETGTV